jgi:valyl-tRNA synthetase
MPFISEEIWHVLAERAPEDDLMVSTMPTADPFDAKILDDFILAQEIIMAIRNHRQEKSISPKDPLELFVKGHLEPKLVPVIRKLGNLSSLTLTEQTPEGMITVLVRGVECSFPVGDAINATEEIAKLQKELDYARGFLRSVEAKLLNEKFMAGAPEQVIKAEQKKRDDAHVKIQTLQNQINTLKSTT